ncbi:Ribosome quality control complex subunit 1 [Trichoderma ghanense]|uniref:Ribosome quality control complex subunit 1 n=1 Tax=Trichoderma ghanense TaxID=65468 RepID=A0ABY2H8Q8_9HYPO
MSTRQLRKLQKQRELEAKAIPEPEGSDDDGDDDEGAPAVAKPRPNLFAALLEEEAEDEDEVEADDADESKEQAPVPDTPAPIATSRKNKKKKKKSKKKAAAPNQDVEHTEDDDEIDRAIRELKIEPKPQAASAPGSTLTSNGLFKMNLYNLKEVHEMRNLFGRETIESAHAEEAEQRRQGLMPQNVDLETFLRGPPGVRKLPEVSRRRNIFIQGREHWPMGSPGGLIMKELGKTYDGTGVEFAYFHNQEYDRTQHMFFAQVQMGDPMRMVHLLIKYPYHVSTLLQVSNVAKQDQNMALASELCERALFSFGRVAPPSFKQHLEQGTARLNFRRPENRQLWLAGYHYIKSLIRKGTYRTALEWAKLLYTLDRTDPYAMRHMIHFLAIRAYEADWLLDFLNQLDPEGSREDTAYILQSRVLADLQIGDEKKAREHLAEGIQRVPWLYCALFQELNLDAPPSVWGINAESDTSAFWVKLYLYLAKDLWNNPRAVELLKDVAKGLGRVDAKALPQDKLPIDLGAARLAYIDGQTSLLALVPRKMLEQQPNYEFDPLPPAQDDNIFTADGCRLPWLEGRREAVPSSQRLDARIAQLEDFLARRVPPATHEDEDRLVDELQNGAFLNENREAEGGAAGEAVPVSNEDRGMIRALIRMFGFGGGAAAADVTGGDDAAGEQYDWEEEEEEEDGDGSGTADLPGAWPSEEGRRE